MPRPVTLFTGQWADLPFEEMCRLASSWGYDGLEIACWGDHFEVDRALQDTIFDGAIHINRRVPRESGAQAIQCGAGDHQLHE